MGQFHPITDLDIQAYIDGELDKTEEKRVRMFIEKNECAHKRYDELKEQKDLIKQWANNSFFH